MWQTGRWIDPPAKTISAPCVEAESPKVFSGGTPSRPVIWPNAIYHDRNDYGRPLPLNLPRSIRLLIDPKIPRPSICEDSTRTSENPKNRTVSGPGKEELAIRLTSTVSEPNNRTMAPNTQNTLRPAISTMSLGRAFASHSLFHKIDRAVAHGFQGLEMFYEDVEYYARDVAKRRASNGDTPRASDDSAASTPSNEDLLTAAREIGEYCAARDIEIIGLQPFLFYEGVRNKAEHEALIEKLKFWFQLIQLLRTDLIQIPSQFRPATGDVTGDLDVIVADMLEVAELGLRESPRCGSRTRVWRGARSSTPGTACGRWCGG